MTHTEAEQPPLIGIPPEELWTTLTFVGQGGEEIVVRLPFDAQEMDDYRIGRDANARLVEQGGRHSGVERKYWITAGQRFPVEWELQDRQAALGKIQQAATVARELMSSGQPTEESFIDFMTVSMLPTRFTAYDPK